MQTSSPQPSHDPDTQRSEKTLLAEYAASSLLPEKGSVFIATGTTSCLVGERLVQEFALRKKLDIYTHSIPFVYRCMELHRAGKTEGSPHVYLVAGFGSSDGEVDLETGLSRHNVKPPKGLYYDYFVWGSSSLDDHAIYARHDADHLKSIISISRNIIILPTSAKFGHSTGKQVRFFKNIQARDKDKKTWHLVVPKILSKIETEKKERNNHINKVVKAFSIIDDAQAKIYDLRQECSL